MATIKIILRTDKVNKKTQLAPLYARIIKDRKTSFISLNERLDPKHWNEEQCKVKKSHPNSVRLNAFLAEKISELNNKILEESSKNRNISTRKLKENILGKPPVDFFGFAYKRLEHIKSRISYSTYHNYKRYIDKYKKFNKSKELYFDDISISAIKDYEYYLLSDLKNCIRTANYSMRIVKIFYNMAVNEGVFVMKTNPFGKRNMKVPESKITFLTDEQFTNLKNYTPQKLKEKIIYDMFIFASYAAGLRFFDVLTLKWLHFNETTKRINKKIHKTKKELQFKVPDQAIEIMLKYKTDETNPNDYVFPFLANEQIFETSEVALFKQRTRLLKNADTCLKKIGKALNLPEKLTFHISRHTFATRALSKGMRIEYVSKLLGHASINQTQVYAKVIDSDLDKAMDMLTVNL